MAINRESQIYTLRPKSNIYSTTKVKYILYDQSQIYTLRPKSNIYSTTKVKYILYDHGYYNFCRDFDQRRFIGKDEQVY